MSNGISRREFVGATALGAAALAASGQRALGAAASNAPFELPSYTKARVLRVFIGRHAGWPKPDLDVAAEAKRLQAGLDDAPGAADMEFVCNAQVPDAEALKPILEQYKDVDGILAVQVSMGTGPMYKAMAATGIPTIAFCAPYSGHEWCLIPDIAKSGQKIDVIPTSDFALAADAYRQFRAIHRLKETKVLFIGGGHPAPELYVAEIKARFGTEIAAYDHQKLAALYEQMDAGLVEAETEQWIKNAAKVIEPSREEIGKSARMCLAIQKALADEKAQAVTINCLGLFGAKALPAYPCFAFTRLNDLGLTGVCEADLLSTMTQLIYTHLSGKPGFVTDPVFDTSNDTLIHAHCVAATKMDGPAGESAPYVIRNHLEDYKGAVLQTQMRVGQEITMAKLVGVKPDVKQKAELAASPLESYGANTMLVSTGKIVNLPDSDRGCRTQITVKVADARRMLDQWSHGLHRVIFYGDYLADTKRFGRLLGVSIIQEG